MKLVLVGVVLKGVQNHSLRALELAATHAGASVQVVPYHGWPELGHALAAVLRARPTVCGISLQTSEAALATMAFAKLLRERGFSGRIVCGGHFATLHAEAILEANAAIDAVVRFAGEEALCGLLHGARTPDELGRLPGLVYRDAAGGIVVGAPARSRRDQPGQPLHTPGIDPESELHLGFAAADLIASHGCEASCAYCCVAGASRLAVQEQRRAGLPPAPYARDTVEGIADQMAVLHHAHGVRVFNVMDDNLLPLAPEAATRWASTLTRALRDRGVGDVALSLQLRADALTPASADALVELGLVRAYVGIDGYSAGQLRALGRRAPATAGAHAIELLAERGVFAVANALLIGPTIAFETVLSELEGLSRIERAPVHLLPIEARRATRYFERASALGLLEGGFLMQHYRFVDRRTELLGRIVTSLPTRLAERSVPIALYDFGYNLGIARRLLPHAALGHLARAYERLARAWNADQLRLLRAAVEVAATGDQARVQAFLAPERERVTAHDRALLAECDAALAELEQIVSGLRSRRVRAHVRGQLLGALALSMSLAGCSHSPESDAQVQAGTGAAQGGSSGSPAIVAVSGTGGAGSGGTPASVGMSGSGVAGVSGMSDAGDAPQCQTGDATMFVDGEVFCCGGLDHGQMLRVGFDAEGRAVTFSSADGSAVSPDAERCLRDFVGDYCFPSLAGTTQELTSHCWIA